ncbi:MCE family protein [Kutzneria viridogrisea]|uniref:MCE family protein n=2 Tax=Kutzneria TaxID=43356 RepID=W5W6H0_9PSEU|nr:MCE family protein [Kutzneria albida]AHH96793.1 MCE family protein [Kutzneria albida DSM 43870]MBA8927988.1 phospholipid/cholesterol/gamma-HCH transport system substrate-binding protein [Kutzneria viridogrisea]
MNRRVWTLLPLTALLAGCGYSGLYDTPLPGGADLGDHPYRVTAEFADVLDLVPQASVKVNDVPVGRVERIELAADNKTALVHLAVNGSVAVPAEARAELGQSSLLGEKYVQLVAPPNGTGRLADGAVISKERTNRSPEIEEVLGALSLLLNGGNLGQLQSIVRELNSAMTGNEAQIRSFLSSVDSVVGTLDGQRDRIVKAIDAINRLSAAVAAQRDDLATALDHLAPGLQVITQQRDQLTSMLRSLDALSTVAVDTVHKTRADLVADLQQLAPILGKLAETGAKLPIAVQYLATYPFTDYAANAIKGDYFNSDIRFDLDLSGLVRALTAGNQPLIQVPSPVSPPKPVPLPLPSQPVPQRKPGGTLLDLLGSLLGGGR